MSRNRMHTHDWKTHRASRQKLKQDHGRSQRLSRLGLNFGPTKDTCALNLHAERATNELCCPGESCISLHQGMLLLLAWLILWHTTACRRSNGPSSPPGLVTP
ncbi:hypothetical protein OBBRIDRAFT_131907 [Obba rivulosa]|uniref:Uncharacterized protein n=1 Tax=Obba rivulosa TaxID=1052685 RepID=A0A8E2AW88_9APHY|nr:hypothetical protein OBBRIDRAFT_131907 [Obba rivulosa]